MTNCFNEMPIGATKYEVSECVYIDFCNANSRNCQLYKTCSDRKNHEICCIIKSSSYTLFLFILNIKVYIATSSSAITVTETRLYVGYPCLLCVRGTSPACHLLCDNTVACFIYTVTEPVPSNLRYNNKAR